MKNYLKLGKEILSKGFVQDTRTGLTTSLLGKSLQFNLKKGFPLMTTKKIKFENIVHEVIWYLKGTDKITYLKENNVNIWNMWADENDSIGPTYGYQWKNFEGINQIENLIEDIKNDGNRRMIICGWNPKRLNEMKLPPCIVLLQFHLEGKNLSMSVYQRSGDYCIGVPYDIAEMALLLELIAKVTNKKAHLLNIFYGDLHIYQEHEKEFLNQLEIIPNKLPKIKLKKIKDINKFKIEDIELLNYNPNKFIKYIVKK